MNPEVFIRMAVGPLMILAIYGLSTFLMGQEFNVSLIMTVIVFYWLYSYFRHIRKK